MSDWRSDLSQAWNGRLRPQWEAEQVAARRQHRGRERAPQLCSVCQRRPGRMRAVGDYERRLCRDCEAVLPR